MDNMKFETMDEMVFADRNKAYGAYQLRKTYNRYLAYATGIALVVYGLLVYSPKIYAWVNDIIISDTKEVPLDKNIVVQMEDVKPQQEEQVVVEEPPQQLEKAIKFTAPEIAKDVKEEEEVATQEELKESQAGKETITEGLEFGSLVDTNVSKTVDVRVEEKPFLVVEEQASFPGGAQSMYEFIGKNIRYPEKALEMEIEGKVYVRFVVGSDGTVKNAEVMRSLDAELDREALRVVRLMPKWKPGRQSGRDVPSYFTLPILFKIQKK